MMFLCVFGVDDYCFKWSSDFLSAAVRQFLLFSSQLAVRGIPFNLSSQEDIILPVTGSPSYFVGVDFSAEDDAIFFSDTAKDIIYKQKVNGTGERHVCCSVAELFSSSLFNHSILVQAKICCAV